ncbi:RagB/SusD family nutrient uptake outer membrane protein [Chitinophaga silvatica]|uniref:RagB/SusD family nutrient uptake outer membrane protein n=1 Tax=Chitinophaga silvatica TaxID=2282649 RepID=A0A3E1Y982_9BACT|nr:RagB/SusD family nutrient uptake outer membrane protein [Chitinophaga silvatica]RFS21964.1 RagB/SusD family nutrient uptake outer membrane protein [Chitinophaga silvatica]
MKKSFKYICAVAMLASFLACNEKEFLKTDDPNRSTEASFWKNENDVSAALAATYSPLRASLYGYWGSFTGIQDINSLGDDVFTIPGEEAPTWAVASFSNNENNGDLSSIYSALYQGIHRANLLIDRIKKVDMSDEKKSAYVAEAKFLRGLAYFLLASNWGNVPIRTVPVETTDGYAIECSPKAKVWEQVVSDFTEAAGKLPAVRDSKEQARATSGAAIAYLGKAYIFMEDYAKAETTFDLLFKAPYNYDLVPNFEDNFTDKNEYNKESVFEWNFSPIGNQYGAWSTESASSPMYNYLPQFIGPPAGGGWFKYLPGNIVVTEFMKEPRPAGSDTKFDKRMYASLMWKRSTLGETDATWYDNKTFDDLWNSAWTKIRRLYPETPMDTTTYGRFLIKKGTSAWRSEKDADNYWGPTPSTANLRIFRFAEVLLLRAEAAAMNGNNGKAIGDINRVRQRAGLIDKLAADLSDKDKIMAEIDHQKLLELFFEQNRVYDLRRWHKTDLGDVYKAHQKQGANGFMPKHYVFPIPGDELKANPKATQNDLWK